jgi:hypothetical protein
MSPGLAKPTDEHIHPALDSYLRLHAPGLAVHIVGDGFGPSRGTLDLKILIWCEAQNAILITDNRRSMPAHLADHIRNGHTVPGIFSINLSMSVAQLGEHLIFVAQVSLPDEYQNSIWFLPIF